jgi:hypothetical protein
MALAACTASGSAPSVDAPTVAAGSTSRTSARADSIFEVDGPVSIAAWWKKHPDFVPEPLVERTLLLDRAGSGPRRFLGPDVRKYDKVLMVITCASKAAYTVRLQVLDGLSIATTSGASCGGPKLATYLSPALRVTDATTEVEVEIPAGTNYYVTVFGLTSG